MDAIIGTLEQRIYSVPSLVPQRRQKPMEVLAVGMSRSGTESLCEALQILGHDHVYHGFDVPESKPQAFQAWTLLARQKFGSKRSPGRGHGKSSITAAHFDRILAHCTAVTDQQAAIFSKELIDAYPDAKIILNWRDPDEWYQSIQQTFGVHMSGFRHHVLPYFHSRLYWRRRYYAEVLDTYFYGSFLGNGRWVYEEHCAKIKGLAEHPDRFLQWRVQDGWAPLCAFLGKHVPDQPFPDGNVSADTLARIRGYLRRDERWAMLNMFGAIIMVAFSIAFIHTRLL